MSSSAPEISPPPPSAASTASTRDRSRRLHTATWFARVPAALILLQTLTFKFTGAPESVYIFETVGQEPWGRIGSGVVELLAAVLLLVPVARCAAIGAALAAGVMSGALFFHATVLGLEVQGDGGLLFGLAVVVFVASLFTLGVLRRELPFIGPRLGGR